MPNFKTQSNINNNVVATVWEFQFNFKSTKIIKILNYHSQNAQLQSHTILFHRLNPRM